MDLQPDELATQLTCDPTTRNPIQNLQLNESTTKLTRHLTHTTRPFDKSKYPTMKLAYRSYNKQSRVANFKI